MFVPFICSLLVYFITYTSAHNSSSCDNFDSKSSNLTVQQNNQLNRFYESCKTLQRQKADSDVDEMNRSFEFDLTRIDSG